MGLRFEVKCLVRSRGERQDLHNQSFPHSPCTLTHPAEGSQLATVPRNALTGILSNPVSSVPRIDENVLGAQLDVDAAHSEILKYFQSVTSNRWLMIKIFLILIVFFIIFVVFLA